MKCCLSDNQTSLTPPVTKHGLPTCKKCVLIALIVFGAATIAWSTSALAIPAHCPTFFAKTFEAIPQGGQIALLALGVLLFLVPIRFLCEKSPLEKRTLKAPVSTAPTSQIDLGAMRENVATRGFPTPQEFRALPQRSSEARDTLCCDWCPPPSEESALLKAKTMFASLDEEHHFFRLMLLYEKKDAALLQFLDLSHQGTIHDTLGYREFDPSRRSLTEKSLRREIRDAFGEMPEFWKYISDTNLHRDQENICILNYCAQQTPTYETTITGEIRKKILEATTREELGEAYQIYKTRHPLAPRPQCNTSLAYIQYIMKKCLTQLLSLEAILDADQLQGNTLEQIKKLDSEERKTRFPHIDFLLRIENKEITTPEERHRESLLARLKALPGIEQKTDQIFVHPTPCLFDEKLEKEIIFLQTGLDEIEDLKEKLEEALQQNKFVLILGYTPEYASLIER